MNDDRFSADNPKTLAIHVIWTTYMSWLPGDQRGHWSPLFDLYGRLTRRGHRLNVGDQTTRKAAAKIGCGSARRLSDTDMRTVSEIIGRVICGGSDVGTHRGMCASAWSVYAAAIESQHLHLLLGANNEDVSLLIGRIKGKCGSAINRTSGRRGDALWSAGYWRVFLFDWEAVRAVCHYIMAHNTRRDMPAHPFGWLTPLPT